MESRITVGFIGLGNMGRPMVHNLLRAGFAVRAFDVLPEATSAATATGAVTAADVAGACVGASFVITMLPDSPDVEGVMLGPGGVVASVRQSTVVIDMSTISPVVTRRIAGALAGLGVPYLDAPVSGGIKGAQEGTLSIMVGGEAEAYERALPVLQAMGKTITYLGASGSGQAAKLCNQIVCAINIQAVCEALALGRALNLDLEQLRTVLLGGAAASWMLENLGPKMIAGDASAGFRIALQLKDLRLANETAFELGVPLPAAALATTMYLEARAHGEDSNGNQAMFKTYDRLTNQK